MQSPLLGKLSDFRLNRTLHGRSVYRKQNVSGHNVVRYYNAPGKGDGIDLFDTAGTPVFACHAGKVTRIFDRQGKLSGCYIVGVSGKYVEHDNITTVYAHLHLKDSIKLNTIIREGDCIGWIGKLLKDPHIHFECEWNGHVICGETPEGMLKHLIEVLQ